MEILVCHDGELGDVCGMLRELGCAFAERIGSLPLSELTRPWDLVVATPLRALRLGSVLARPETRSIVVTDPGTRTVGRRFHQLGVEWIVRRPVHRAALRLLLQHALYRGPERRRAERVSVGLPIRFRARWIPHRALLREISLRGASVVSAQRVAPGRRIALHLGETGQALVLRGEVVRCRVAAAGEHELGIAFDPHPLTPLQEVRRLVDRFARGPAQCIDPALEAAHDREAGRDAARELAIPPAERRDSHRRPFARRVIALTGDAPRVLIGRDLSLGGMAVDPNVSLAAGQKLRLALHVRAGEVPLVVDAEVVRSDSLGSGLRFEALGPAERSELTRMLDALPGLAVPGADEGEERRVLAEMVER